MKWRILIKKSVKQSALQVNFFKDYNIIEGEFLYNGICYICSKNITGCIKCSYAMNKLTCEVKII